MREPTRSRILTPEMLTQWGTEATIEVAVTVHCAHRLVYQSVHAGHHDTLIHREETPDGNTETFLTFRFNGLHRGEDYALTVSVPELLHAVHEFDAVRG